MQIHRWCSSWGSVMLRFSRSAIYAAVGGLLAMVAVAAPGSARADVIDVFTLIGAFDNGSTLSGSVTVDITIGEARALDALADGSTFDDINTQFSDGTNYILAATPSGVVSPHLFLGFTIADLVGYTGGPLSTGSRVDDLTGGGATRLTSGSAVFASSTVPEPSTWALMILGFAGVGVFAVRRAGKTTAAATV
jgi:PEP-CTERM motif